MMLSYMDKVLAAAAASLLLGWASPAAASSSFEVKAQSAIAPFASYNVTYETVTGYFLQDEPSTNASTFSYINTNFGLINQTYNKHQSLNGTQTQWERFAHRVLQLNLKSPSNVKYKVIFFGRHGEGQHNAAESYYGTPAWNCYWAELNGNATNSWVDARLTPNGVLQAQLANQAFAHLFQVQKAPFFQSYYTSPLTRCLQTANITFSSLDLPAPYSFIPTVKEYLRESIDAHTCDQRSSMNYILDNFPGYKIEPNFPQVDELWNGVIGETQLGQDTRSRKALNDIFTSDDSTWISVTSHSGEIGSILRVLGHQPFSLSTGAVIPVLIRATVQELSPGQPGVLPTTSYAQPTPTATWSVTYTCTAPPVTSGSAGCVCPGGATPVP